MLCVPVTRFSSGLKSRKSMRAPHDCLSLDSREPDEVASRKSEYKDLRPLIVRRVRMQRLPSRLRRRASLAAGPLGPVALPTFSSLPVLYDRILRDIYSAQCHNHADCSTLCKVREHIWRPMWKRCRRS